MRKRIDAQPSGPLLDVCVEDFSPQLRDKPTHASRSEATRTCVTDRHKPATAESS